MIVFEFKNASLELLEGNIVIIRSNDNIELDVDDMNEIFAKRSELLGDKHYAVIHIAGEHAGITNEARKLAAEPEHALFRDAFAMVISSLAQRMIGNFYLKFDQPPSPTRVFTDEKKAYEWVKSFKGIGERKQS